MVCQSIAANSAVSADVRGGDGATSREGAGPTPGPRSGRGWGATGVVAIVAGVAVVGSAGVAGVVGAGVASGVSAGVAAVTAGGVVEAGFCHLNYTHQYIEPVFGQCYLKCN